MPTTKLFYQTPIGGVAYFDKPLNACITEEQASMGVGFVGELANDFNGSVAFDIAPMNDSNKYIKFTDIMAVGYKVLLDLVDQLQGGTPPYLIEGMGVKAKYTYYNPFNYPLSVGQLDLHLYYTSMLLTPEVTLPANSNVPANSATTTTTMSTRFLVRTPDVEGNTLYNIPIWKFNINRTEDSRLLTSGNTDISANLIAYPIPYYSTSGCMAKEVIFRPYVVLRRSRGGNLNSGATETIYADVYNKNEKSFTNLKVTLSLSGSGFSGGSGTLSRTTLAGITVGATTSQNNITKTTVSFTYTAPSSTSRGTATIRPNINAFYYNGINMNNHAQYWSGTGNTISITVNAAAPAARYLPFYITFEGTYVTANDFGTYFQDGITLNVGPCTDHNTLQGVPNTMSDETGGTIFYFSTTTFSSITYDNSCPMLLATDGDYEFSSNELDVDYTLPTSATFSAFRSAGIFTLEGAYSPVGGSCGAGAIIKLDQDQNGIIFFSAYPEESSAIPLDANGYLRHLYLRLKLHYQNSSYSPGFSRDRTLIYDLASRVWNSRSGSYENGVIGNYYDESNYFDCATNVYAISDTWANARISVMDLAANGGSSSYGGAYISIELSTSTSGPWSDLSLIGNLPTFYNRTWILGDIDTALQSYLQEDEQTSPYTYYWCSMMDTLKEPCAQMAAL